MTSYVPLSKINENIDSVFTSSVRKSNSFKVMFSILCSSTIEFASLTAGAE